MVLDDCVVDLGLRVSLVQTVLRGWLVGELPLDATR